MLHDKSILTIIPARGGSKGVPRKNCRIVGGKPLLAWTIEEAKKSKYIDRLILSSDDEDIIEIAKAWDCEVPFIRPSALAQDDSLAMDVIIHAMNMMPAYDCVMLLQATSPLRNVDDIDGCIEQFINQQAKACVSVSQAEQSPYWMYTLKVNGKLNPLLSADYSLARRQDLPPAYILNGAMYMAQNEWLRKYKNFVTHETIGYVMPVERSLDIDTEIDFEILEKYRG